MSSDKKSLEVGYYHVPPGNIANTVICMEMREKPILDINFDKYPNLSLERVQNPDLKQYRDFYREVGANWLWDKHLALSDEKLLELLNNPLIETYILMEQSVPVGLLQLDFEEQGECEIVYFGIIAGKIGKGMGRYLMYKAFELAWNHPIKRLWLHTCNFDSPDAVGIYQHFGFRAYAYMIEVVPDARLKGIIPRTAAPHVPLIE